MARSTVEIFADATEPYSHRSRVGAGTNPIQNIEPQTIEKVNFNYTKMLLLIIPITIGFIAFITFFRWKK